ncbi:MAG TPA: hypothetical protein VIV12_24870 [Streptosporangiaceae bacterium]
MSKTIEIYTVTEAFVMGGVEYKPGDQWTPPAGWARGTHPVLDATALLQRPDRLLFEHAVPTGMDRETQKPILSVLHEIVPVKAA